MDKNAQALAQLHDIHLPQAIGMWPLAPGWYVLLGLFCLVFLSVSIIAWRYYAHGLAKRQALRTLARYEIEYHQDQNSQRSSAAISELLKRVALAYYPREQVASLQGEAWLNFLNQMSKDVDFNRVRDALLVCPYQPKAQQDLNLLFDLARRWIRARRQPHV